MPDVPTDEEVQAFLNKHSNWGRWGDDDNRGALNLVTPEKRLEAIGLVQTGRQVSLSRYWPKRPGPLNPSPAQHFPQWTDRGVSGGAVDYYGISYHGYTTTHIDALCHVWDADGGWQGRNYADVMTSTGARHGAVTAWEDGIVTRGVLLDVPRFRGEPFVTVDNPVTGAELAAVANAQGVEVRPGDALAVYSGREKWQDEHPTTFMGGGGSPGLHASCSMFIRERDVAMLSWDMMDYRAPDSELPWPVHSVLYKFGVCLMDNALLQPLAEACVEEGRQDFMLMVLPLRVEGGTGSPVNPVAMF